MFQPDATDKRLAYPTRGAGVGGEARQLDHGVATECGHQYQGRTQSGRRESIQTGILQKYHKNHTSNSHGANMRIFEDPQSIFAIIAPAQAIDEVGPSVHMQSASDQ